MKFLFQTAVALTIAAAVVPAVVAACGSDDSTGGAANNANGEDGAGGTGADSTTGGNSSSGSGSSGGSSGSNTGSMDAGGGQGMDAATLITYDGPPPNVDGSMVACPTPDALPIKYSPVFSGYDGVHTYQVPVFVVGVDPGTVTWSASDPSMVTLTPYVRGIMITTKKAGELDIIASVGSMCGSTHLSIASYTPDQWSLGNARYNNGNPLSIDMDAAGNFDGMFDGNFDGNFGDAGIDASGFDADVLCQRFMNAGAMNPFENPPAACTNCHGAMSNGMLFGMTLFMDVQHTPEQTGGFSEDDLTNAFYNGIIPDGGTFDPSIVPYCLWHQVHTWHDIDSSDNQAGMRAYLRSLTPQEQTGCFELFNLMKCADGGM